MQACPYCYGSPAVVCCGLCGSTGVVSVATASIYNQAKIDGKDTLHLRIELRKCDETKQAVDTGYIHRRATLRQIEAEVAVMLAEAEKERSVEVLAGNIVKEALWQGEVTAFKKVLYLLNQSR